MTVKIYDLITYKLFGGVAGVSIDMTQNVQPWGRYSTDFKEVKTNGDTSFPNLKTGFGKSTLVIDFNFHS
jgi:hypothetical protein